MKKERRNGEVRHGRGRKEEEGGKGGGAKKDARAEEQIIHSVS